MKLAWSNSSKLMWDGIKQVYLFENGLLCIFKDKVRNSPRALENPGVKGLGNII
jgi:hypothetical protein